MAGEGFFAITGFWAAERRPFDFADLTAAMIAGRFSEAELLDREAGDAARREDAPRPEGGFKVFLFAKRSRENQSEGAETTMEQTPLI